MPLIIDLTSGAPFSSVRFKTLHKLNKRMNRFIYEKYLNNIINNIVINIALSKQIKGGTKRMLEHAL